MDSLKILRLWAACAWADNDLHPSEAAAIERLIAASDDLSPDQRIEAKALLTAAPEVDVNEVKQLSTSAREGVYRAALQIVKLDRQVTADEEAFLTRLRAALDIDEATVARIEANA
jgi:hypothetical protein